MEGIAERSTGLDGGAPGQNMTKSEGDLRGYTGTLRLY